LPVAALLAVGIRPIVKVVFGFDAAGTEMVVWATRAYLLGLAGHSLLEVAARSFYAMQDARTPLFAAALNALAYILFAIPLSRQLGHSGIALANSLAFSGEALLLLYLLNRKLPGILRVENTLLKVVGVSAAGMALVYGLMRLPLPTLPVTLAALVVGGFAVLPFIWSEVKLLIKL
jgi:putative peptidoglycan lipid II flippase